MSMRIFSGISCLLLAGCGSVANDGDNATTAPIADPAPRVACASGAAPLAPVCSYSTARTDDGTVLMLVNPDGGFHRLLVGKSGVTAVDGAAYRLVSGKEGDAITISIGDDRYRLPAKLMGTR